VRLGNGSIQIDPERQEISGFNPVHRIYAGDGQSAGFSGYFVIQFDRPFQVGGTWAGSRRHEGALVQDSEGGAPGAFVSFGLKGDTTLRARIGTSFVSVDQARKNLAAEMPDFDFDAAAGRARDAWTAALEKIKVAGSSPDRRIFYTAMYHAMLLPRIYSDRSGTYPSFAGGQPIQHADGFVYYCDYSVWDTFRAVHPMLTILDPARELDMVKSLIAKGQQGGFLPIFPAWNSYTSEMVGDHAGAIITDAYVKGIRGFDAEAAYQLMRRNGMEEPPNEELYRDGRGRRALTSYLKYGYIPLEDHVPFAFHKDEQVSRTLEYAYDDYEVSVLAKALGHTEDAERFSKRAKNYRNVIDPETGFARGRHADGSWVTPFDPAKPASYITEGLPWQYTFFAPQDIPGLISAVHGRASFVEKLDGLFKGGYYDQGNEPSHHIAYLYDDAGEPWKTQQHVHEIMSTQYRDGPAGLSGNDDAGQMSAWYVMSALGFYAVTPGVPRYSIGTPRFDDVRIEVAPGRFLHVHAAGAEAGRFYIRSIRLNGIRLNRFYLSHSELTGGGELEFEMSATPVIQAESEKPAR
jgi:predicted alpha-1,2-mannosidase